MFRTLTRSLHRSARLNAASVFRMPAMSPTMTEGGITNWKLKGGEAFSAGDVLLEVETDKATIDVEAQDDGIMYEILINDGASGIPVGKPIAFLAEPGDDLSTLEKPKIEEEPQSKPEEPATKEPEPESKKTEADKPARSHGSATTFTKANPKQTLFPSVEMLLHKNHISPEDAFEKIEASGPNGRLLKGDILAYLGEISKDSLSSVAQFISERSHLDLKDIKLKAPEPAAPAAEAESKAKEVPPPPKNVISYKLSAHFEVSKDQFKHSFEASIRNAIKKAYAIKYPAYSTGPTPGKSNDLFYDLLIPSPTKSRFEVFDIKYKFPKNSQPLYDLFDDLMAVPSASTSAPVESNVVDVEFKVKYNKLIDSKEMVDTFQDILLDQIPSNKLIIDN